MLYTSLFSTVHGFDKAVYEIFEEQKAIIHFTTNVKGTSNETDLKMALFGTITSESITAGESFLNIMCIAIKNVFFPVEPCDYVELSPIAVTDPGAEIALLTLDNDIALEDDKFIRVIFNSTHDIYKEDLEKEGEFFRDTALVKIMDNDSEFSAGRERCRTFQFYFLLSFRRIAHQF